MQYVLCFIVQQNIITTAIKTCNAATKWAVSCPRCLSITVYM